MRKVKSEAQVSQRTPFARVLLEVPTGWREILGRAETDLRAAGRITGTLEIQERSDVLDPRVVVHEFQTA